MPIEVEQVVQLIAAKYEISKDQIIMALELAENQVECKEIFRLFHDSMFGVKAGYSQFDQSDKIVTEINIDRLVTRIWGNAAKAKRVCPQIYLSHDIDYLWKTCPYAIKGVLAERVFSFPNRKDQFLDSIETLLKIDKKYIRNGESGTCFVYSKVLAGNLFHNAAAWLMDPSYCLVDQEFSALAALISDHGSHIGIHGSYFAWSRPDQFQSECLALSARTNKKIISHRAHWLNIKSLNDFRLMYKAGIKVDSSMGFNGTLGFRGGMPRIFQIQIGENKYITEVPLLVMDGPLFLNRRKRNQKAIEKVKAQLALVADVGGSVSFDWHDRSAHKDYTWSELYEELLEYGRSLGFEFLNMRDLEREV